MSHPLPERRMTKMASSFTDQRPISSVPTKESVSGTVAGRDAVAPCLVSQISIRYIRHQSFRRVPWKSCKCENSGPQIITDRSGKIIKDNVCSLTSEDNIP